MKTTVNAAEKTTLAVIVFGSMFAAAMGNSAHAAIMHVTDATGNTNGFLVEATENQNYDLDAMQIGVADNFNAIATVRGELTNINTKQNDQDALISTADGKAQAAIDGVKTNITAIDAANHRIDSTNLDLLGETNIREAADNSLAHQINLTNGALQQTDDKAQAAIDGVKTNVADIDNLKTDKADVASLNNEIKQRQTDVANIIQDQRDTATKQATTDANQSALISDAANVAANATTTANSATTVANNATTVANAATTSAMAAQDKADVAYSTGVYAQQQAVDAATVAAANKAAVANVQAKQKAQDTAIQNHAAVLSNHETRITSLENQNNARFSSLENQQNQDRKEYRSGIAGAASIAGLHYVDTDNAVAIGAADFKSEQGYAMGYRHKFAENVAATVSYAGTSNGDSVVAASASLGW